MRCFSRLDDEQCERLNDATLGVLGRTGLIVDEPAGPELLRRAGAKVVDNPMCIGDDLVEWALRVAPKSITLHGRDAEPALRCGGPGLDATAFAAARVERILAEHDPPPKADAVIDAVLAKAQARVRPG